MLIWWKKFIELFLSRTRYNLCAYNFVCKFSDVRGSNDDRCLVFLVVVLPRDPIDKIFYGFGVFLAKLRGSFTRPQRDSRKTIDAEVEWRSADTKREKAVISVFLSFSLSFSLDHRPLADCSLQEDDPLRPKARGTMVLLGNYAHTPTRAYIHK